MINSPIISTEAGWKKLKRRQRIAQRLLVALLIAGCVAPFLVLHLTW